MAIAPTLLTAGFDDTDSASHATASITLPANQLILLAVHKSRAAAATQTITATSTGATWVSIGQQVFNSTATPRSRVALFRTMVASDQTDAITMATTSTHDCAVWSVVAFAGVDTSGADGAGAIVQSNPEAGDGDGAMNSTLAAFADAVNNAAYQAVSTDGTTIFSPTDLTVLHEEESTVPARALWTGWKLGEDLALFVDFDVLRDWGAVAVEIKAAVAVVAGGPAFAGSRGLFKLAPQRWG